MLRARSTASAGASYVFQPLPALERHSSERKGKQPKAKIGKAGLDRPPHTPNQQLLDDLEGRGGSVYPWKTWVGC